MLAKTSPYLKHLSNIHYFLKLEFIAMTTFSVEQLDCCVTEQGTPTNNNSVS